MNMDGLRRRFAKVAFENDEDASKKSPLNRVGKFKYLTWILILMYIYVIFIVSRSISDQLPAPWPSSAHGDLRDLSKFSEDRAMQHLLVLTSFRPRTVGTDGNDKLAVNYFLKEAEAIRKKASPLMNIEIDHQIVSGSFQLKFLGGFNNVYRNVHNALIRIGPEFPDTNITVLVNCHFDAAIGVDGASDDLSQCVVMLEALTVLSQRGMLPCYVLFMFNGAEESILQASHGFITKHPWAKSIAAFINLEAAGSGGRDALFQAGPKHPWLVRAYSKVPYPCGNSLGEEIFQSGIIPSDTDFRIFRDHGDLPGVDIAYVENGYVYHTHFDEVAQIRPGTLQRAGENLLALIYGVVTSAELFELEHCHECSSDSTVYFDCLGLGFVMYSHYTGTVVNYFFSIAAFLAICVDLRREFEHLRDLGVEKTLSVWKVIALVTIGVAGSLIAPIIVTAFLGFCISAVAPLSWYAKPSLAIFLYVCPALGTIFKIHQLLSASRTMITLPGNSKEVFIYNIVGAVWICALILLTVLELNSAFVILFMVAGPIPIRFILFTLQPLTRKDTSAYFLAHIVSVVISTIHMLYIAMATLEVFIPLFGRTGSQLNPDVALGIWVGFISSCVASYYTSLIPMTDKRVVDVIIKILCAAFLIATALIFFTSYGFPYSSPPGKIAPKRMALQHSNRKVFALDGTVESDENGIWVVPLDYLGVYPLEQILDIAKGVPSNSSLLYEGLPFIYPMMELLRHHVFVPVSEAPPVPVTSVLKRVSDVPREEKTRRLTFEVDLVDHSNIYVSPSKDCILLGWNLTEAEPMEGPKWNERSTYFVFLVSGYDAKSPVFQKIFWLDLQCPNQQVVPIVHITVVNHLLTESSSLLNRILKAFPEWVATIRWISTVHAHIF